MNIQWLVNCENILCKDWEGFNPLQNPMVYGVGTPSPAGAIVRGLLLLLPFVVPTLLFTVLWIERGGEKKNE
jgi:hypothetical protein